MNSSHSYLSRVCCSCRPPPLQLHPLRLHLLLPQPRVVPKEKTFQPWRTEWVDLREVRPQHPNRYQPNRVRYLIKQCNNHDKCSILRNNSNMDSINIMHSNNMDSNVPCKWHNIDLRRLGYRTSSHSRNNARL